VSMRSIRAPVRFCKPSFGENGGKKRAKHGFLKKKRAKHGFSSILCSSKKTKNGCREACVDETRRVAASADELRGRRKLCQLQCPCVEFVLDSHALELRVLGLFFGVESCLPGSFENTAVKHAHFSVETPTPVGFRQSSRSFFFPAPHPNLSSIDMYKMTVGNGQS